MRLFLRYISRFLIFFFTIFLFIVIGNYWLIKLTPINFPSKKNILVLGDSAPECAINDKIFKKSVNFSAPAESYYYSYLKLKKILETKQAVDTVLLSFSPHNIFDNTWFASQSNIQHNFCRYYPFMSRNDFRFLLESHPKSVIYSLRPIALQFLKNIFRRVLGDNVLQIGGFTSLDLDRLEDALQSLKDGKAIKDFRLPKDLYPTNVEIVYLNKILQLCNEKQVKLILINLPKRVELLRHKRYGMEEFQKLYNTEFSQLDYFDFSSMPMEDEMYADLLHLNKEGSSYFSKFLETSDWESFRYVQ
jgi:hypothetical protein